MRFSVNGARGGADREGGQVSIRKISRLRFYQQPLTVQMTQHLPCTGLVVSFGSLASLASLATIKRHARSK